MEIQLHQKKNNLYGISMEEEQTNSIDIRTKYTHNRTEFVVDDDDDDDESTVQFVTPRPSTGAAPMTPESTVWSNSPCRAVATSPEITTRGGMSMSMSKAAVVYNCVASLHRPDGDIVSIAVTEEFIFVGCESGRVHSWKLPECSGMGYMKARAKCGEVRAMFGCGRTLFTSHGDFRVRMWDVKTGMKSFKPTKLATLPQRASILTPTRKMMMKKKNSHRHRDVISCLAYNIADKLLYTGSWDSTVKAWNISEKRCVDSFIAHEGHVKAMVINQQNGSVFTSSSDGSVKIWRRVFGQSSHILTMLLKLNLSPVNALALSAGFLYAGSSDGLINFWEKENSSGRYNHGGFLQGHHFSVLCLVTVNNDLILSGSEDTSIRVWRREDKGNCCLLHSCISIIEGHHGPVRCLAAAAAAMHQTDSMGNLLVCSASMDQSFKVWRVKICGSDHHHQKPVTMGGSGGDVNSSEMKMMMMRRGSNPVLSPSWVENRKRIHG